MRGLRKRHLGLLLGLAIASAAAEPAPKPWYVSPISPADTKMRAIHPTDENVYTLYSESHAILIGQVEYAYWPDLQKSRGHILELRDALEKHRFKVEVYFDLDSDSLPSVMDSFMRRRATVVDSRIFVFVSGHGWERTPLDRPTGYLLPVDAPLESRDNKQQLASKALAMPYFAAWARLPDPRHMLFVFDACFSGSFFGRPNSSAPLPEGRADEALITTIRLAAKAAKRAPLAHGPEADDYIFQPQPMGKGRQFLTAGSQGEVVPEDSVFTQLLIDSLAGHNGGEGHLNFDHWLTAGELGGWLGQNTRRLYRGKSNAASPVFAALRDENYEAGDMVFTRLDIPNPYLESPLAPEYAVPEKPDKRDRDVVPGQPEPVQLGSAAESAIQAQVNALSSADAPTRRGARDKLSTLLAELPSAQRQSAVERLLNQLSSKSYRFQLGVATALAQQPDVVARNDSNSALQELLKASVVNKDQTLSKALKQAISKVDR